MHGWLDGCGGGAAVVAVGDSDTRTSHTLSLYMRRRIEHMILCLDGTNRCVH